jgi:hypothetical protein
MAKWRLFGKPKEKETTQTKERLDEVKVEPIKEEKNEPLAEYSETLYTEDSRPKKSKGHENLHQKTWRNVDLIEEKVDTLHITRAQKPTTDVAKKVDRIISEKESKISEPCIKPSNIVYVLSMPQPGEVKGDWAVQINKEIASHHKTKETAINEARRIAKQKNATVMVQNIDGTFSQIFKPK